MGGGGCGGGKGTWRTSHQRISEAKRMHWEHRGIELGEAEL